MPENQLTPNTTLNQNPTEHQQNHPQIATQAAPAITGEPSNSRSWALGIGFSGLSCCSLGSAVALATGAIGQSSYASIPFFLFSALTGGLGARSFIGYGPDGDVRCQNMRNSVFGFFNCCTGAEEESTLIPLNSRSPNTMT